MKPKVGFIGLGAMGTGMALNIYKAGFPLTIFDIDLKAVEKLAQAGATPATDLSELARRSDVIILCLPDTSVVQKLLWGDNGLAGVLAGGQIVIDCGTSHPLKTIEFHQRLCAANIQFLDAPVSGMAQRAIEGTLATMAGGSGELFERVKPVLSSFSKTVVHMGGPGCGQLAKVINNVLFNISCAAIGELLPLAVKIGLDAEKMVEVAGTGSGQSFALNMFGPLILKRDFKQGFPMKNAYKDMSSIVEIMNTYKIPIPVTQAALLTYQIALNQGFGDEAKSAMVKVWENVLGVEVKKSDIAG